MNKHLNIVLLADYFSPESFGGAGIVSFDEAQALIRMGHSVSVITTTHKQQEVGEHMYEGIRIFRLYSNYNQRWRAYVSVWNPQVTRKVQEILLRIRPDVVHAHSVHTHVSYYSLKVAKKSGSKVYVTMHDVMAVHYGKFTEFIDPTNLSVPKKFNYKIHALKLFVTFRGHYNPLRNMAIRHYLNYADKIFAVSDALKQVLNANRIYNVEVIHNGIRLVDWNSSVEEVLAFKKKHGLVGKKVILFSGWSTAAKGGDQLLQSLEKIVAEVPEVVLVAAGRTDIYYTSMRETALRRGLSHYIVFPGWLAGTESIAAYMSADVVVFPSICMDTFGMVNLEAMASKKPLVSTCFGGASEIVVDGVTGYIVNPYDFETMARRISMLLIDSHRANEFGQAGYDRVKRYFVKDDKMRDIVSWYTR